MRVTDICTELDIPYINLNEISSNCIKQVISDDHYQELKEQIANCKKMQKNKKEDFREVQSYITLELPSGLDVKYRRLGGKAALTWQESKGKQDTQSHCLCLQWEVLRP